MSFAKSYAQVLMESLPTDKPDVLDQVYDALASFMAGVKADPQLEKLWNSPTLQCNDKWPVLDQLGDKGLSLIVPFLKLVVQNRRTHDLPLICKAFEDLKWSKQGVLRGMITAADQISEALKKELEGLFSKKLGKKVLFECQIEPECIAGLKVTVAGVTYDGTLGFQLNQLEEACDHRS